MANALYGKGRNSFATAGINWTGDTIKVNLVNTSSYTVAINTDQFLSDIPGGAIIAAGVTITSASATLGTVNGATVTFSSVSGSQVGAMVIYKDTGTGSTSNLIAYIDTATGLPLTPNGGNVTVTWDTGTNKIFTLFEGLSEKDVTLANLLKRWLKDWLGIAADLGPGGLWIPRPKVVQEPAIILA